MIRFVMEVRRRLDAGHTEFVDLFTIDAPCPDLEEALRRGGFNRESGAFEVVNLLGVELLPEVIDPPVKRRHVGDGYRLLSFARAGEAFDGSLLLSRAAGSDHELAARLSRVQVKDHLRRLAQAGKIRKVVPGQRGRGGFEALYELTAGETELERQKEEP